MTESQKKEVLDMLSDITHSSTVNSAAVIPVSHQMYWDADSLEDGLDCLFKDVPNIHPTVKDPSHQLKG